MVREVTEREPGLTGAQRVVALSASQLIGNDVPADSEQCCRGWRTVVHDETIRARSDGCTSIAVVVVVARDIGDRKRTTVAAVDGAGCSVG